jgi:hypothetical protein
MQTIYATKDNLKLPIGGVIPHEDNENDYIFGASPVSATRKILEPTKNWLNTALRLVDLIGGYQNLEIQKTHDGQDTYWCVTFTKNNVKRLLHLRKYGYDLNADERFLAISSGTVKFRGNSVKAVVDADRNNGFRKQGKLTTEMTLNECYAKLTDADYSDAKTSLDFYDLPYEMLDRASNGFSTLPYSDTATILSALAFAPLMVTVDGNYEMDDEGRIGATGKILNYNHEVTLLGAHFEGTAITWWDVWCSECKQFLKFRPDYRFGWPCLIDVNKKDMRLFKKKSEAAIYFLNSKDGLLVPYADGVITGGDMFKILFGDYKYAPIEVVDELPFPVASYQMTTN